MNQQITSGVIYDSNELDRIRGWVKKQQTDFSASEKAIGQKQWLVAGGIIVVAAAVLLLVTKKIL